MTEIYLHFLFAHYGLYGNAPVASTVAMEAEVPGAVMAAALSWPAAIAATSAATSFLLTLIWKFVAFPFSIAVISRAFGPSCGACETFWPSNSGEFRTTRPIPVRITSLFRHRASKFKPLKPTAQYCTNRQNSCAGRSVCKHALTSSSHCLDSC